MLQVGLLEPTLLPPVLQSSWELVITMKQTYVATFVCTVEIGTYVVGSSRALPYAVSLTVIHLHVTISTA